MTCSTSTVTVLEAGRVFGSALTVYWTLPCLFIIIFTFQTTCCDHFIYQLIVITDSHHWGALLSITSVLHYCYSELDHASVSAYLSPNQVYFTWMLIRSSQFLVSTERSADEWYISVSIPAWTFPSKMNLDLHWKPHCAAGYYCTVLLALFHWWIPANHWAIAHNTSNLRANLKCSHY